MKITDGGICKFLVALTRAKERVCIYTGKDVYPTYVEWIADEFIDDRTGDRPPAGHQRAIHLAA